MRGIANFLAITFIVIILPGVYDFFNNSYEIGDSTMNMGWPVWPSKLAAVFGLTLFSVRLLLELFANVRMIADPDQEPIAIPRTLDPLEEAVD